MYVLAIFVPPLAVLLCGRPFQAIINGVVWLLGGLFAVAIIGIPFVIGAIIHACLIVSAYGAEQRNRQLIQAIRESQHTKD